ncbi:MAG: MFS transporter [Sphaerobacteraceae bacterium]|nr:MAG: MFS transporter [Sphaerobacteraceae bacterium]
MSAAYAATRDNNRSGMSQSAQTTEPSGVATRREYTILFAVIITMMVNQTAVVIISPLAVEIARDFDVSVSLSGQLRTVSALLSALLAPFVGLMSDRLGRRPVMFLGLLSILTCGLASTVAPTFALLMAAQTIAGFGIASLLSSGYAVIADNFPAERRAWAVGIITIGQPMAWVVGLPLIGLVADEFGWRWSFLAVPVLFSLVGIVALRYVPASGGAPSGAAGSRPLASLGTILRERSPRSWILAELAAYSGWAGSLVFLGAFYISEHGRSTALTGVLLSVIALAFVVGSLFSNRIVIRFGIRQTMVWAATVSSFGLALALILIPGVWVSMTLLMLFGFMQGIRGAAASVLGLMQSPEHQGAMMGFRASVVQMGYVLGGIVGGAFLAAGGYALLGTMFGLLIVGASIAMATQVEIRQPGVPTQKPG